MAVESEENSPEAILRDRVEVLTDAVELFNDPMFNGFSFEEKGQLLDILKEETERAESLLRSTRAENTRIHEEQLDRQEAQNGISEIGAVDDLIGYLVTFNAEWESDSWRQRLRGYQRIREALIADKEKKDVGGEDKARAARRADLLGHFITMMRVDGWENRKEALEFLRGGLSSGEDPRYANSISITDYDKYSSMIIQNIALPELEGAMALVDELLAEEKRRGLFNKQTLSDATKEIIAGRLMETLRVNLSNRFWDYNEETRVWTKREDFDQAAWDRVVKNLYNEEVANYLEGGASQFFGDVEAAPSETRADDLRFWPDNFLGIRFWEDFNDREKVLAGLTLGKGEGWTSFSDAHQDDLRNLSIHYAIEFESNFGQIERKRVGPTGLPEIRAFIQGDPDVRRFRYVLIENDRQPTIQIYDPRIASWANVQMRPRNLRGVVGLYYTQGVEQ